jgi:hypothetical protein
MEQCSIVTCGDHDLYAKKLRGDPWTSNDLIGLKL